MLLYGEYDAVSGTWQAPERIETTYTSSLVSPIGNDGTIAYCDKRFGV